MEAVIFNIIGGIGIFCGLLLLVNVIIIYRNRFPKGGRK